MPAWPIDENCFIGKKKNKNSMHLTLLEFILIQILFLVKGSKWK